MTNIRAERVVISRRGRKIKRIEEEIKRRGERRGGNGTTDRQQRPSGEGDIVRIRLLRWRQIPLWILCLSIRGILVIKGSGVLRSFLLSHPVSDCCSHPEPSMRFHAPLRFVPPPLYFDRSLSKVLSLCLCLWIIFLTSCFFNPLEIWFSRYWIIIGIILGKREFFGSISKMLPSNFKSWSNLSRLADGRTNVWDCWFHLVHTEVLLSKVAFSSLGREG